MRDFFVFQLGKNDLEKKQGQIKGNPVVDGCVGAVTHVQHLGGKSIDMVFTVEKAPLT